MKLLLLTALIIATPVSPAIKYDEPKVVRQTCSQQTFDRVCVPKIKTVQADKVNWI